MNNTLAAMLALSLLAGAAHAEAPAPANQLTLSASATGEVARDLLDITFSVQREGPDAATVQAQLMQALEPALAEARKAARPGQIDISSGNFSVFPRYAAKGGVTSWQGSAEMRAEGRDIAGLTKLVGRISTMSVARVNYGLSREAREKAHAELSTQAISRFKAQAEAYARAFGFNAITLRAVEVSSSDPPPGQAMFRAARSDAAMSAEALPVEAGKAPLTVSVSGSVQMLK